MGFRPPARKKEAPPPQKTREVELVLEDLNEMPGGGYTFGFTGLPNTGKTTTAMLLGYLHEDFVPEYEDRYPLTAKAILDGTIPHVSEIVVIDSENALRKQMKRPLERKLFGDLFRHTKVKVLQIPPVAQDVYDSLENGMNVSQESVTRVFDAISMYEGMLRKAMSFNDDVLFILDSASRLYKLLTAKSMIVYNKRVQDKGEETARNEGFNKFTNRNLWWDQDMTLLRGVPGWVVGTFQMKEKKDFVINMEKKSGTYKSPYKVDRSDDTPFNLDMDYIFSLDEEKNIEVSVNVGRYVHRGDDNEKNVVKIDVEDKFSALQLIENILEVSYK